MDLGGDGLALAAIHAADLSRQHRGRWDVWYRREGGYQILQDWGHAPSDLLREGWVRVVTFSGGVVTADLTGEFREGRAHVLVVQEEASPEAR